MGNYSPTQIFKQEPAALVSLLALINAAVMSFNVYTMTDKQLSIVNAALLALFTAFYIRPLTVSKNAMSEMANQNDV